MLHIVYLQPGGHQHRQVSYSASSSPSPFIASCTSSALMPHAHMLLTSPHLPEVLLSRTFILLFPLYPPPPARTRSSSRTGAHTIHTPERSTGKDRLSAARRELTVPLVQLLWLHPHRNHFLKQPRFNGTSVIHDGSLNRESHDL